MAADDVLVTGVVDDVGIIVGAGREKNEDRLGALSFVAVTNVGFVEGWRPGIVDVWGNVDIL